MPQLPDTITRSTAQALRNVTSEKSYFSMQDQDGSEQKLKRYEVEAKRQGLELVGQGHESAVIAPEKRGLLPTWAKDAPDRLRDDVVVAIDKFTLPPKTAKVFFYTQLLLSTLFPHNFPRFYAAFGSTDHKEPSGTIRQKIVKASATPEKINFPFSFVESELTKMGIKLQFDYNHIWNFIITDQGEEYYIDKPQRIKPTFQQMHENVNPYKTFSSHIDVEKVAAYLKDSSAYSDASKAKLLRLIERIKQLEQS